MGVSPIRGAVGLCFEFTSWNFSSPSKKGRCVSQSAGGCYRSQVCGICTHGRPVYRTPGFHEFGAGSSGTPLARSLYRDILQAVSWDSPFQLSADAQSEVVFWEKNFCNTGYPIWSPSPKPEVLTYSDASDSGWGGFAVQLRLVGKWQ